MPAKSRRVDVSDQYILEFKNLHHAFTALMALKPWTIIHESIILGVRHPESGIFYYAYFMGKLGEVVGFNIYRGGDVKPWLFIREQTDEDAFTAEEMLSHSFYQLSSEKKSKAPAEVLSLHMAAGIEVPRGVAGYLDTVTYRGGYMPRQMREDELSEVQALLPGFSFLLQEIANGRLTDAEALDYHDACYVATQQADGLWQASEEELPSAEQANLFYAELSAEDREALEHLRKMPMAKEDFVIHAALLPMGTPNEEGVGIFPLGLFCIGAEGGLILGFAMLDITRWQWKAASELTNILRQRKSRPKRLIVSDIRLFPLVNECAEALDIKCLYDERAASFTDQVVGGLLKHMGR